MQTINRSRQRGDTRRAISVGQKRHLPVDCSVCAMSIMKSDREIPRRRIVLNAKLKILHFILRGDLRLLILSSSAAPSTAETNSNQSRLLLGLPARTNIVQISKRCQCQISDSHHKRRTANITANVCSIVIPATDKQESTHASNTRHCVTANTLVPFVRPCFDQSLDNLKGR